MFNPADQLETSIRIAVAAHAGQRDRAGEAYILHPMRVMHRVGKHQDWIVSCAAILHDVIEDCHPRFTTEIETLLHPRIGYLVKLLSHIKPENYKDLTNKQKDALYFDYIRNLGSQPQGKVIKLADLKDNLFHPARRRGWIGHEAGKARYLKAYFYLTEGEEIE